MRAIRARWPRVDFLNPRVGTHLAKDARKLAEATNGEVGNDDPIRAQAMGEPSAEERDPDPIKMMAEGAA